VDIVLGVSMAPTTIRMVLVEGENADGVTVEEDNIDTADRASDQVIAAILGTREGAADSGYQLTSTGVTWTDPADAAALRDALAARKIENVMLVSAFLAAAALAQTVGNAMGYEQTAMLFVEPTTATLAVVDASDGSVSDVQRRPLRSDDVAGELAAMVADLDGLETRPEGLFLVGSGVDVAAIKPALEATTWLPVSAPEEPETALARGAALASANAPLFASSTSALAYAQDPGTGKIDPYAVAPGYLEVLSGDASGDVAYSAVADDEADAVTSVLSSDGGLNDPRQGRRPLLLVGSALAVVFVTATLALEIALALGIRPTVALLPAPVQRLIEPTEAAPAPPPAASVSEPQPPAAHMSAPAPVHVVPPPRPLAVPAPPAAPPVPVPAPAPAAPAPVPVPIPIPIRVPAPAPPVQAPAPAPIQISIPQPPLQLPQPPVQQPTPPVHVPTPPVRQPTPPVQVPTPPVRQPTPPIHLPTPPVQQPTPPIHLPTPPVQQPTPPVHLPTPPVQDPTPPLRLPAPRPPVNFPAPQPPANLPSPEPPMRLPILQAPQMPTMPAPQAPSMPAMPAPVMPQMPSMPAPAAPAMPSMPHFNIPSFKF
jgi:hypothetical protein